MKVNSFPTLQEQLTPKLYADQVIFLNFVDEPLLLRLDPDEKLRLDEQDSIVLNSSLSLPKRVLKVPTKSYVVSTLNDPSIIRNNNQVDFKDKNLDNVRFVKVYSLPAVQLHFTPKFYVDEAIFYWLDELSLLGLDPDEKMKLDEQDFIILNSTFTKPKTILEIPTKSYVDSSHETNRNRRDLSPAFNDQDNEFDKNKLTNLDSVTVNRNPNLDNELANKKYIDDEVDKNNVLTLNQTLQNYPIVSVGNDTYNLTKYEKIQRTETTVIKYPDTGGYLIQNWVIKCIDKILMVIYKTLLNQQKHTAQLVILEQQAYLISVIALCI